MIYRNKIEREDRQQLHLTSDKRLRYTPPKLPSATSFIRNTLYAIGRLKKKRIFIKMSLAKLNIDKGDNKI